MYQYHTFFSACAAFRNLLMKQYGVGTDILNLSVFTIYLSCINFNVISLIFLSFAQKMKMLTIFTISRISALV